MPFPIAAPVAWALFKRFWWVLPVLGAVWFAYDWSYDRGVASQAKKIAKITKERDDYKKEVDDLDRRVKLQNEGFTTAVGGLKKDHEAIVAGLTSRLNDAEKRAGKTKVITKEVPYYVSAKADAACTVPAGFVRLHDIAAQNSDPGPEAPRVAASGPPNADAPSGVALSAVAGTVRDNYATCHDSAEKLKAWQEWFPKAKAAWDKAAAIINKAGGNPQ